MDNGKVVQTELNDKDYETLTMAAKSKRMTIKEAAREAIVQWAISSSDLSDDPLLKVKPVPFKQKVKADEIDNVLYR